MEEKHHSAVGIRVDEHGMHLPTRSSVSRRGKIVMVVIGVLLAAGAARTVVVSDAEPQPARRGRRAEHASVRDRRASGRCGHRRQRCAARRCAASSADLCPRERAALAGRHRRAREAGPDARRTRRARAEPGTRAGHRAAPAGKPHSRSRRRRSTARRLRQRDAVSQQELDDRQGAFNQGTANLAAADANMRRLTELKGFQRIAAPIDGSSRSATSTSAISSVPATRAARCSRSCRPTGCASTCRCRRRTRSR